jgi:hypothetical protein
MAGTQPHEEDKRLMVVFSHEPRLDKTRSVEEGRNVYRDVEFVTIRIPGDKTLSIHRPVNVSDKHRFPMQYQAFKNAAGQLLSGTPLQTWPGITPAQVKELEYFNVRTVEQLASMADTGAAQMMGVQKLKRSAQQYIAAAKDAAPLLKVQAELETRDNEIAALKDMLMKQGEAIAKLQPKK